MSAKLQRPSHLGAKLTGRIKVLDTAEVQCLSAIRYWPGLFAESREGCAVQVRQPQAVAVMFVPVASVIDVGTEAPVLGGLFRAGAQRSLGTAQAVDLVIAPATAVDRNCPLCGACG